MYDLSFNAESEESKILHETVIRNFNKTPKGRVYDSSLKDIFALLMMCLDLKENRDRSRLNLLAKVYPFTFFEDEALRAMEHLEYKADLVTTSTTISYSIKTKLGKSLLRKFYDAKLLHIPDDRTRSTISSNCLLQPTPKGLSVAYNYCKKNGGWTGNFPSVFTSNLNSMDLFLFERNPITDRVLYSEYLIQLLFVKMMGEEPNVWDPNKKADPLPSVDLKCDFTDPRYTQFKAKRLSEIISRDLPHKNLQENIWDRSMKDNDCTRVGSRQKGHCLQKKAENEISPLHHKFFTNPESDSHVQYYVSNSGVRFTKDKIFHDKNNKQLRMEMCLTGKAICQWLNDCTDLISANHANEIASLLLKYQLLRPIMHKPSIASEKSFMNHRLAFYMINISSLKLLNWSTQMKLQMSNSLSNFQKYLSYKPVDHKQIEVASSSSETPLMLKNYLRDPGIRYLFRRHLEKEYCSENLDAYVQLYQFEKRIRILKNLMLLPEKANSSRVLEVKLQTSQECMNLAYHIYFSFISKESHSMLNIDYSLQDRIEKLLISKILKKDSSHEYIRTPLIQEKFDLSQTGSLMSDSDSVQQSSVSLFENNSEDFSPSELRDQLSESTSRLPFNNAALQCAHTISTTNLDGYYAMLLEINSLFIEVKKAIFRLMEVDSYPKFLNSEIYRNATSFISIISSI